MLRKSQKLCLAVNNQQLKSLFTVLIPIDINGDKSKIIKQNDRKLSDSKLGFTTNKKKEHYYFTFHLNVSR